MSGAMAIASWITASAASSCPLPASRRPRCARRRGFRGCRATAFSALRAQPHRPRSSPAPDCDADGAPHRSGATRRHAMLRARRRQDRHGAPAQRRDRRGSLPLPAPSQSLCGRLPQPRQVALLERATGRVARAEPDDAGPVRSRAALRPKHHRAGLDDPVQCFASGETLHPAAHRLSQSGLMRRSVPGPDRSQLSERRLPCLWTTGLADNSPWLWKVFEPWNASAWQGSWIRWLRRFLRSAS